MDGLSLSRQLRAQGGTHCGQDTIHHRATPAFTWTGTISVHQLTWCTHLWDVGGNQSPWRKSTQTWGDCANSTQTESWPGIDFFFHQCCNKMTLNETTSLKTRCISDIMQYLSSSDLFHLEWCPQYASTLSQMAGCSSSSWLNNIPPCLSICLFIYHLSICTYHIFFIQSPVDRYLRCFHMLAFVNNAARKTLFKVALCTVLYVLYVSSHLFFIIIFRYSYY